MAEPLRHRQTKEADNRYVRPTATAPHLDSTRIDKTQYEYNESASLLTPDVSLRCRERSKRAQAVWKVASML
jgi:hypothetical protein